jgi:hypothetical protein
VFARDAPLTLRADAWQLEKLQSLNVTKSFDAIEAATTVDDEPKKKLLLHR